MVDPAMPNLSFFNKKKESFFFFFKKVYKYARHIFLYLNLKLMAIIRTTKMKCSLFTVIIQKEVLYYQGLQLYIFVFS